MASTQTLSADAEQQQRDYYRRTAEHYDSMHVNRTDEHGLALAMFSGFARLTDARTILDVGAGTGRALELLGELIPEASTTGVEPVRELREIGHARGIAEDRLVDGDALALSFADNSFDFVIETGVLHHIGTPAGAVAEMVRVARRGVFISDANKLGQGSRPLRVIKALVHSLGAWNLMIRATNRGKLAKYSEGDGVFYSYSVFDDLDVVRAKFPRLHLLNTTPLVGDSVKHGAPSVALLALR
jgi:ubiquinone/menaquinone biosynthesis C-methylase UbiE